MMGLGRGSVASAGKKNIIFTVGDQINAEQTQALYTTTNSPIRGVAHWYNDRTQIDNGGGLGTGWGSGWINSSDTTFQGHYALGQCIQAIIWLADVDAYAVSSQFYNTDLPYLLNNIHLGHGPNYGECYVVLFTELDTYNDGLANYSDRLRTSYLNSVTTIRGMTLPSGAAIRVGLGFGGYNWSNATPTLDLSFWEPCIAVSDFTCVQEMQHAADATSLLEPQIRHSVAQLGSYGKPVMISHFELWGQDSFADTGWTAFVNAALANDAWMAARKRDGLFFWNFMVEPNVNNTANEPTWTNALTALRKHRARHTSFTHWKGIPNIFRTTATDTSPTLNYAQYGAPPSNSASSSGCTNSIVTTEGIGYLHDVGGASASTPNGTNPAVSPGAFTFWNDVPSGTGVYNWQHVRWRCRPDVDTQSVAGYYWAHQGKLTATSGSAGNDWYAGLQSRSALSGNPKAINFAIWGGVTGAAGDIAGTVSQAFSGEGTGWQVMAPFTWTAGRIYYFKFSVDGSRGSRWFSLHIKDETTGTVTFVGSIQASTTDAWYVRGVSYNFTELFGQVSPATTCPLLPRSTTWFSPPIFSQG